MRGLRKYLTSQLEHASENFENLMKISKSVAYGGTQGHEYLGEFIISLDKLSDAVEDEIIRLNNLDILYEEEPSKAEKELCDFVGTLRAADVFAVGRKSVVDTEYVYKEEYNMIAGPFPKLQEAFHYSEEGAVILRLSPSGHTTPLYVWTGTTWVPILATPSGG